ncbi:unnamed protein product [Zymoseptoria tritici ST99CH_3D1]|nr:unnamed protein product [Zymoseptoria tritici ST99CH_3D1]
MPYTRLPVPIPILTTTHACAFTSITSFASTAYTYTLSALQPNPYTPTHATVIINAAYAAVGTRTAWNKMLTTIDMGRRPGPPFLKLREGALKCKIVLEDVIEEEDVPGGGYVRVMKVQWKEGWFAGTAWVPGGPLRAEVEEEKLRIREEAGAVASIEVMPTPGEGKTEVKRAVVFFGAPRKGRKAVMEIWRVDGSDGVEVLGSVVGCEKRGDGSKALRVKVDVEGVKGLVLEGVIPERMFAAHFRVVEEGGKE